MRQAQDFFTPPFVGEEELAAEAVATVAEAEEEASHGGVQPASNGTLFALTATGAPLRSSPPLLCKPCRPRPALAHIRDEAVVVVGGCTCGV